MEEIFRDIEGYNGSYQVSNLGRVKSFKNGHENGTVVSKSNSYRIITINGHGSLTKTAAMKSMRKNFYGKWEILGIPILVFHLNYI